MERLSLRLFCCGLLLAPASAFAYVGPGAGLSLLGALWALAVAVVTALVFVVAWPVRRMLRRRRAENARRERETHETDEDRERPALVAVEGHGKREEPARPRRG